MREDFFFFLTTYILWYVFRSYSVLSCFGLAADSKYTASTLHDGHDGADDGGSDDEDDDHHSEGVVNIAHGDGGNNQGFLRSGPRV